MITNNITSNSLAKDSEVQKNAGISLFREANGIVDHQKQRLKHCIKYKDSNLVTGRIYIM